MSAFDMLNTVRKYKKIVAWGAGRLFEKHHDLLEGKFSYIVDKKSKLWGEKRNGVEIKAPEELRKEEEKEACLIVVFNIRFEEIVNSAKVMGAFDIIDIKMVEILSQYCRVPEAIFENQIDVSQSILVCAGIHALWGTNGSRKFIDGQNEIIHRKGIATIEVAPLLYYKGCDNENPFLAVSVNGSYQGTFLLKSFLCKVTRVRGIIIHSLYYNHSILGVLLRQIKVQKNILYYLHDYYCICENRFFYYQRKSCLNSDDSLNCHICDFQGAQKENFLFHKELFEKYAVKLISPSQDTAKRVEQFYTDEMIVIPHLSFQEIELKKTQKVVKRIAYIGGAYWLKGWDNYKTIVKRLRGKYEFFCLGKCMEKDSLEEITYVDICLGESNGVLNMTKALEKYEIDVVYLGAVWPETFSYTYYEAYEAGCFILTNKQSGNICAQVRKNKNGLVFEDLEETICWLENREKVTEAVANMCKRIVDVKANETFMEYIL
ncbi:MAG: glycosyltransferase family 4 protein [Lachnospiraceae bacterium]|nr:glycosyltransferase family 4 protein [Lachnospiraceae bacterium]